MVHEQDLHTRKNADIIPYLLLISIQVKLRPSNRVHVRKTQIHRQLITKCINRLLWYLYNGHLVSHSTPKKKLHLSQNPKKETMRSIAYLIQRKRETAIRPLRLKCQMGRKKDKE